MSFDEFFANATHGLLPFPYQREMPNRAQIPWLLDAPTAAGKTAAAVLGWLWRRRFHPDATVRDATPRRLVYCLPMRVLVEQTVRNARRWLSSLDLLGRTPGEAGKVGVYQLMGGHVEMDWDAWPEAEAILVGTQDQLLSRALNRGYSMSRYRWPVDFAFLNSGCLWVMDEIQLMGAGLPTTSQLHAFRDRFGTHGPVSSLWMSATLQQDKLATVDAPPPEEFNERVLSLDESDLQNPELSRRVTAPKPLDMLDLALTSQARSTYASGLAEEIAEAHEAGSLTLVVLNQVRRAQEVAQALREDPPGEVLLLHSRFRAADRRSLQERLDSEVPDEGRIVVSTQAVEAGVDIYARTLFTELAPWSSLVQRFGRCNRKGEWSRDEARVYWIDLQTDMEPYEEEHLEIARDLLGDLDDAGIETVSDIEDPTPSQPTQVLRRRDLLELFDTTPDLAGNDIDVSPFIRETEDLDVSVLWRHVEEDTPAAPAPDELCPVVLRDFKESGLPQRVPRPKVWDPLEDQWVPVDRLRPGMTVLLDAAAGGYDPELGWWPDAEGEVLPIALLPSERAKAEGYDDDRLATARRFVSLSGHAQDVAEEVDALLRDLSVPDEVAEALRVAALWHDLGKAHPYFQKLLLAGLPEDDPHRSGGPWAKSAHYARPKEPERPHFRHELASALAMLQHDVGDLAAYLVASHHGKVRLSIRSLPGEKHPEEGGRFARGVWDGDLLPAVTLPDGTEVPETTLSLQVMELGASEAGPSWLERTLRLRDEYGPFRLAFLEALLRVADWRASAKEREQDG